MPQKIIPGAYYYINLHFLQIDDHIHPTLFNAR